MTQELTAREQIQTWLRYYGVTEQVEIDQEAEDLLLGALGSEDVTRVWVDKDGSLIIEAGEDE